MKKILAAAVVNALMCSTALAVEVTYASGITGDGVRVFQELVKPWEEETGNKAVLVPMPSSTTDQFGQYRLWLAAGNKDIDLYQTDVIWAPQLADHFVDLSEVATDIAEQNFPSIIESQTVDGKLVALPLFTDAPALFYRKDLLEKHGEDVPETWEELTETAKRIQDAERAEGNKELWGYVWQANAYEGLTCNALELIKSYGGGQIVEPDGSISVNNEKAAAALNLAATWPGNISPEGVLAYKEEEARGVWQTGKAVFMRNWPYAYHLGNGEDSEVAGKFSVAPLPSGEKGGSSAATLGGWNVAVSKYSERQEAAISLATYLAGPEAQKRRALLASNLPTLEALYDDAEIAEQQPIIPQWKEVFMQAVPRPSAPTKSAYNEVSSKFWNAVHNTLSGKATAEENLEILELDLEEMKGSGW
ncbi:ABC transporter substrate-binding protein [Nitratireductor sp. CH_MIT9313-5]|uniref:ABC transporter substrate-binding protein n=1 Tax=Nitratireductor sp. CH_MIT9313-5 TaxID=3107764 RepID=UPI00300B70A2